MEGYKTYIVAGLIILCSILKSLGYMDENTYQTLLGILVGAGFATVRMAQKSEAEKATSGLNVVSRKLTAMQDDCK